jgi:hypothetical protein
MPARLLPRTSRRILAGAILRQTHGALPCRHEPEAWPRAHSRSGRCRVRCPSKLGRPSLRRTPSLRGPSTKGDASTTGASAAERPPEPASCGAGSTVTVSVARMAADARAGRCGFGPGVSARSRCGAWRPAVPDRRCGILDAGPLEAAEPGSAPRPFRTTAPAQTAVSPRARLPPFGCPRHAAQPVHDRSDCRLTLASCKTRKLRVIIFPTRVVKIQRGSRR